MTKIQDKGVSERWGEFRFSVIGVLLSAPPTLGDIKNAIRELAARTWCHPITGEPIQFGISTIERWYYAARNEKRSPVKRLQRKVRCDLGGTREITEEAKTLLHAQYASHQSWSIKLHSDNLKITLLKNKLLSPSYSTLLRYMQQQGLVKRITTTAADRAGQRRALSRLERYEVRSFESDLVGALFHLDFHHCSRKVFDIRQGWVTPIALAVLDDCSRLVCHLQWYLHERAEELVHGVSQAFLKIGLPRALLSDNGGAMISAEFTEGLSRLGIVASTTLPYSPYQNGKQERFFSSLEGRLIAMLEGIEDLSLQRLNQVSQAWVEMEYNRSLHRELGVTPARKYLDTKSVLRSASSFQELQMAFRKRIRRKQRKTDGTVSIEAQRFEIPSAYRTLKDISIDYASWNLGLVHMVDRRTGTVLCQIHPINKSANASGERRKIITSQPSPTPSSGEPPLLKKLLEDFAATGLPPRYIPHNEDNSGEDHSGAL